MSDLEISNSIKNKAEAIRNSNIEILVPDFEPNITYKIIHIEKKEGGLIEVVSTQTIREKTFYAWRLVDCTKAQAKYLGVGDSLEEALVLRPDQNMWDLTHGSASYWVSKTACEHI